MSDVRAEAAAAQNGQACIEERGSCCIETRKTIVRQAMVVKKAHREGYVGAAVQKNYSRATVDAGAVFVGQNLLVWYDETPSNHHDERDAKQ